MVFVSATSVVLAWQLPTIAKSAGINFFLLSYNLQEVDSEGNTTHRGLPDGVTHMVPYQQARTPGAAVSGLNSDALYEFQVSVNYSDPVLLSAEASVTVHTNPSSKFNCFCNSVTKCVPCFAHPTEFTDWLKLFIYFCYALEVMIYTEAAYL